MSRRVPRGGPGPEWPNEPDDGQAYGHRGAQRNGYGPTGTTWGLTPTAATGTALPVRISSSSTASTVSTVSTAGPGRGGPAFLGAVTGPAAGQEGAVAAHAAVLPPSYRPHRQRAGRGVPCLCMFSAGQAAFKNNGQGLSANLAEWARDHYLGPVVTFGEWVSYNPPPKGGNPSFSLAVPSGEALSPSSLRKAKNAFTPDIPATLKSLAGSSIAGEGQWRVVEKVGGEPAMLTTFLRDATYTSQVNGIASIDQRLVKFSLRPGTEDPGTSQNWGVPSYIPAGKYTGLLATFNGGFKLDSAGGGFYLNGLYHGTLVKGTASIVYYKNGTIKIGEWGRDFTMNSSIAGVRQNLKLLVDHGQVAADASSDAMTNWGATLGGGYYVWRSGIGITKDGRVVYVYGSALNAQDLGLLLQRRRCRGHADGHQPRLDEVRLLPGQDQPRRPDAGDAAAHPAAQCLLLLHPLHPRLHRGLRAVTINSRGLLVVLLSGVTALAACSTLTAPNQRQRPPPPRPPPRPPPARPPPLAARLRALEAAAPEPAVTGRRRFPGR